MCLCLHFSLALLRGVWRGQVVIVVHLAIVSVVLVVVVVVVPVLTQQVLTVVGKAQKVGAILVIVAGLAALGADENRRVSATIIAKATDWRRRDGRTIFRLLRRRGQRQWLRRRIIPSTVENLLAIMALHSLGFISTFMPRG